MQTMMNQPTPQLHAFICINDRSERNKQTKKIDPNYQCMASCAPQITADTVRKVKAWIINQGLMHEVLITKTKCLGICPKDAGVMVIYGKQNQETIQGLWYNNIQNEKDIINAIKEQLT